jgi:hypothetical protein
MMQSLVANFSVHRTGFNTRTVHVGFMMENVYLSNIPAIATENLLVLLFSLCSQHVSAPTGHLQVKYNYITS